MRDSLGKALRDCYDQLVAVNDRAGKRRLRLPDACWEELRGAIGDFTHHAKDAGVRPEHVIIRIKEVAGEKAPAFDPDSPLRDAITRLSLEAYFRPE